MDKEKLENLTNYYLIKECGCNPQYLDKKGNTFFTMLQKIVEEVEKFIKFHLVGLHLV